MFWSQTVHFSSLSSVKVTRGCIHPGCRLRVWAFRGGRSNWCWANGDSRARRICPKPKLTAGKTLSPVWCTVRWKPDGSLKKLTLIHSLLEIRTGRTKRKGNTTHEKVIVESFVVLFCIAYSRHYLCLFLRRFTYSIICISILRFKRL